jgi:hypothetical protein
MNEAATMTIKRRESSIEQDLTRGRDSMGV